MRSDLHTASFLTRIKIKQSLSVCGRLGSYYFGVSYIPTALATCFYFLLTLQATGPKSSNQTIRIERKPHGCATVHSSTRSVSCPRAIHRHVCHRFTQWWSATESEEADASTDHHAQTIRSCDHARRTCGWLDICILRNKSTRKARSSHRQPIEDARCEEYRERVLECRCNHHTHTGIWRYENGRPRLRAFKRRLSVRYRAW